MSAVLWNLFDYVAYVTTLPTPLCRACGLQPAGHSQPSQLLYGSEICMLCHVVSSCVMRRYVLLCPILLAVV